MGVAEEKGLTVPQDIPPDVAAFLQETHEKNQRAGVNEQGVPNDPEAAKIMQGYQANTTPRYDGNILIPAKFKPIDLSAPKDTSPAAQAIQGAHGTAIGLMNNLGLAPANIPHFAEAIVRAPGEEVNQSQGFLGKIYDKLSQASEHSTIPPVDVDTIEKTINAGSKYISGIVKDFANQILGNPTSVVKPSYSDIADAEQSKIDKANQVPGYQAGLTAGNVGSAAYGLVALASSLKGMAGSLMGLRGADAIQETAAANPKALAEAKKLSEELVGKLGHEMESHLFKTDTKAIEAMVKGGPDARQTLPMVENIRNELSQNKEVLGSAIGELRGVITSNDKTVFDTTFAQNKMNELQSKYTLSGGTSSLTSRQKGVFENVQNLLKNPGADGATNAFTTKDADLIIKKIDSELSASGYYKALDMGQKVDPVMHDLSQLRQGMDAEIADMYPQYKAIKTAYADFEQAYHPFQSRLAENRGESFVANLSGANKAELRKNFEGLLNKGKDTVSLFKELSAEVSTGSAVHDASFAKSVQALKDSAAKIKFQDGKDVMNEVTNRAVASKLANLSDMEADRIRQLVIDRADSKATKYAGLAGSVAAGIAHVAGIGEISAGAVTAGAAKFLLKGPLTNQARSYLTAENLFKLIAESRETSAVREAAKTISTTFDKLGPASGMALISGIKLTPEMESAINRAAAVAGGMTATQKLGEKK